MGDRLKGAICVGHKSVTKGTIRVGRKVTTEAGQVALKNTDEVVQAATKQTSRAAVATGKGTQLETVQRWMSKSELEATKETGLFRGGRGGTHYATDAANSSPLRARQRLSLDHTPEVRVELEVPAGRFSQPTRVAPLIENGRVTMPGGGMERTAVGDVPTRVIRVYE